MTQSLHIGLYWPFANLPFGICAIYFDLKVINLQSYIPSSVWTSKLCLLDFLLPLDNENLCWVGQHLPWMQPLGTSRFFFHRANYKLDSKMPRKGILEKHHKEGIHLRWNTAKLYAHLQKKNSTLRITTNPLIEGFFTLYSMVLRSPIHHFLRSPKFLGNKNPSDTRPRDIYFVRICITGTSIKDLPGKKIHVPSLKTNVAPENGWLEYYLPFGMAYFQVLCCYVSFREGTYFCFSSHTRVMKKLPILGKSNHTHVRMVSLKDFPYNKWIVWVGNVMSPAIVMEMKTGPFQQKLPFKFGHVPYPWLWEIESMSFWVWEKKSKEWSLKKLDVQSETDFWVRLEKDGVNFKRLDVPSLKLT